MKSPSFFHKRHRIKAAVPRGTLLHVILLSPAVTREQQVIMSAVEEPGRGRMSREVVVDLQLTFMDE